MDSSEVFPEWFPIIILPLLSVLSFCFLIFSCVWLCIIQNYFHVCRKCKHIHSDLCYSKIGTLDKCLNCGHSNHKICNVNGPKQVVIKKPISYNEETKVITGYNSITKYGIRKKAIGEHRGLVDKVRKVKKLKTIEVPYQYYEDVPRIVYGTERYSVPRTEMITTYRSDGSSQITPVTTFVEQTRQTCETKMEKVLKVTNEMKEIEIEEDEHYQEEDTIIDYIDESYSYVEKVPIYKTKTIEKIRYEEETVTQIIPCGCSNFKDAPKACHCPQNVAVENVSLYSFIFGHFLCWSTIVLIFVTFFGYYAFFIGIAAFILFAIITWFWKFCIYEGCIENRRKSPKRSTLLPK